MRHNQTSLTPRFFWKDRSIREFLPPVVALLLFAAALFVIHRTLEPYNLQEIRNAFHAIPAWRIDLCLLFSCLSYCVLSGYDVLAFRYLGKPLPYGKIALTSFLSYSFANNTGSLSIIASSGVRYRLYGSWGFSGADVTRIIGFCVISFWLGFLFLTGITGLIHPAIGTLRFNTHYPYAGYLVGTACLLPVGGYILLACFRKKIMRFGKWEIPIPSPVIVLGQVTVGSLDFLCAGAALFVLLPFPDASFFFTFIGLYLLALLLGLASNVPGGLGVFEGSLLLLLGSSTGNPQLVGALLAYRAIYYLLPLGLSVLILGILELRRKAIGIVRLATGFYGIISTLLPQLFGLATFAAGAVMLFSGTLPVIGNRLDWLTRLIPLSVLELSHFLNSIIGSCLLVLAVGLRRRLDMAYLTSCCLLFAGIVVSLLKGLDYEEAILLTVILIALYISREQFYRKASLLGEPWSASWFAAVLLVVSGAVWLGFFAYRHQDYSSDLWWSFALHGHASRFLRAMVGIIATMLFFALLKLFRPSQPRPEPATEVDLRKAESIAGQSGTTYGFLALLGDKSLLFSSGDDAFLMYGVQGRSWIAMGGPVGKTNVKGELLWHFRDLCEYHGGWPVFYEISGENLSQYIDLGLNIIKIGEEGRVFLPQFSLIGGNRKNLRYLYNRFAREGYVFEIIPPAETEHVLPALSAISSSWLASKNAAEKGFSLGFFKEDYLRRFPIAVAKKDGKILAFANLWPAGNLQELSIDLMRYLPASPHSIMEYLFISIMLWGKDQGYQWFSFGMAPLAGLDRQKVASLWSNIGAFVYRHGEHFYNFQGLREYKDKFAPVWEAKYLAYPQAFSLPAIFINLSTLIGGSVKGLIRR